MAITSDVKGRALDVSTATVHHDQLPSGARYNASLLRRIVATVLDGGFAVLIVGNGAVSLVNDYVLNPRTLYSWQVSDVLINYAAGPVRRGLLGEVLRMFNARGHRVDVSLLIFAFSMAAWLLTSAFLWRQSRRADFITRVVLLFSPILLAFPLNAADAFGRKDSLSLIYICCGLLTLSLKERPGRSLFMTLAIVGLPALVATHEASFFFCLPSTIVLYLVHVTRRETISIGMAGFRVCALVAPTLAAFALVAAHPGDSNQALKICQAAAQQYPALPCEPLPHAMESFTPALQDSYGAVIREPWRSHAIYWSLAGSLAYLSCLLLAARTALTSSVVGKLNVRTDDLLVVGAFVVLPTIPLYAVGADYGRWLSVASTIAVLLLTNQNVMVPIAKWIRKVSHAIEPDDDANRRRRVAVTARVLMVTTALLTPFLFLPHQPPSLLVLRMVSGKTLGLSDLAGFVSAVVAH